MSKKEDESHKCFDGISQKMAYINKKHQFRYEIGVFNDPYGIRTRVTAVKGRCLNHLTNGPFMQYLRNLVAAEGIEPPTLRV